jgi:dTDP-4-amino-4,6-dideoxygalactose transaminase
MPISFLDLRRQHEEVGADVRAAVERVLAGGSYVLGREVEAFEREWARFCGVRACAGVGNGTDALALALLASGAVRPGRRDEVITAPLTAGYTALGILNAGGVPVFADVDPRRYTLDPRGLERALTPRTRAVVPVHLYGQMADMEAVCDFAQRRGLVVVEDAAQAHGARLGTVGARAWGHAAAFSFYPTKNLGAYGDGGAVTSDDAHLIERVKELRQGGHPSALGRTGRGAQLAARRATGGDAARQAEASRRVEQAAAATGGAVSTPAEARRQTTRAPFGAPGRGLTRLSPLRRASPERERLRAHLAARGVETLIHYPYALHLQTLFRRRVRPALPAAERLAGEVLSLPLYPQLREDELRVVADAVLEFERMKDGGIS